MQHIYLAVALLFTLISFPATSQDQPWRSELYPFDWQRGYERDGKFLHDFSFAGYHYGEKDIPENQENILDVTLAPFLADNTGSTDATDAIQAAIDSIAQLGKGVVYLPEGTYLVSPRGTNALTISSDSTVIRGAGPDLTFILNTETNMRSKSIFQFTPGGSNWYSANGGSISLTQDAAEHDTLIHVENAAHFSEGDRIVLTSDFTADFIAEHMMTGKWNTSMEGVAFARTVKAVDASANTILIDIPIRYYLKLRDRARAHRIGKSIRECGIENLSIGNIENPKSGLAENDYNVGGTAAYEVHASHAIKFSYAENCWARQIHTFKPASNTTDIHLLSNGLQLFQSRLVTVDSCIFQRSQYEGGGGNGYMFILQGNDCLISNTQAIHSRHNYDFKKPYTNGNVIYNSLSKDSKYATDFHMHLSMSNLFDNHTVDNDFLEAVYRPYGTVEHGHSSTQSVFWNTRGEKYHGNSSRIIASGQWGYGYVVGTKGNATGVTLPIDNNTAPKDHLEGEAAGEWLHPVSLYKDQLHRRLQGMSGVDSTNWDAPVIKLISPGNDEQIQGNSVLIEVELETPASMVAKVIFSEGENVLGEVTESPFNFLWEDAPEGCYTLSVQAIATSGTPSSIESSEVIVGRGCEASYYGFAFDLPGKVEAEYFNKGRNNHSYFDTDEANLGGDYRIAEPVDIERCSDTGAGYNIGWIAAGEYLRYVVEVPTAGKYDISFRVASENSGSIAFDFVSQGLTGLAEIASTGGWQTWETVTLNEIDLQAGIDTLQLTFAGGFNLNYIEVQVSPEQVPLGAPEDGGVAIYPNPSKDYLTIHAQDSPVNGYTIYSIDGALVMKRDIPQSNHLQIDIRALPSGIYLMELKSGDDSRVVRVVKQ